MVIAKKDLGLSYPPTASRADRKKVDAFYELTSMLFPEGVKSIPTREQILTKIKSGSFSIRDGWLMKIANEGLFIGGNTLKTAETKEIANALKDAFPATKTPQQPDTFRDYVKGLIKSGVNLDQDYNEFTQTTLETLKKSTIKNVKPLNNLIENVRKPDYTLPSPNVKGGQKLKKGAVPKSLLTEILAAIKSIPDDNMRNAVVASLLGYRGSDVTGTRTSSFLVGEGQKNRPVYDLESKESGIVKDIEFGLTDKKQIGGSKPLGPVMKLIYDRGLDAAGETGEIFPDIETDDISKVLKEYVFSKIDPDVIASLDKAPTGFTDLRRITASAIVNDLANEAYEAGDTARADMFRKLGDQLIGHEIPDSNVYGKVLSTFYTGVDDIAAMDQRKDVLYQFERLLATRINKTDSKVSLNPRALATQLGLKPPKNFNPPKYTEVAPLQKTLVDKVAISQQDAPVSEALLKAEDEGAVASTQRQTATDFEVATQKKISAAEEIIANEEKLKEAERVKAEVKEVGKNITAQKKIDKKNLKKQEAAKILDELTNEFGVRDSTKPKGGLSKKLGVATAIAVGATGVAKASPFLPVVTAPFMADEAGNLIADKLTEFGVVESPDVIPEKVQDTAGFISELAPITPTDLKTASDVASFLAEKPAQAASKWEQGFLGAIKSQIR